MFPQPMYDTINPPVWFNSVLCFFFALAPWFHAMLKKQHVGHLHRLGLFGACVLLRIVMAIAWREELWRQDVLFNWYFAPSCWIAIPFLGILAYPSDLNSLSVKGRTDVIGAVLLFLVLVPVEFPSTVKRDWRTIFHGPKNICFGDGGLWLLLPMLWMFVQGLLSTESITGKILQFPPLVWLGKLSYFIYLFHIPVSKIYVYIFRRATGAST